MKLSDELIARGFIHQYTGDGLDDIFDGEKKTIYHGIDPSADSAHIGNMVIWMLLHHLVKYGHQIIFLVGGGTGMIGDPKPNAERVLKDISITDNNVSKIKTQAQRLIGGGDAIITFVNNKDWLIEEGLLTFLRDIGKHFTVNELIKKDAIAKRIDSDNGISYTEFAYPLLQGYDYLVLHRKYGCTVQVGGSDQWGNIISGVDLIRRKEKKIVHAVTTPLIVDKSTGKKFGKSEGNAVWLDAEKTSPYLFYQFWLNVSDNGVIDYLRLFTLLSLGEIVEIEEKFQIDPGSRIAQKRLATEVTTFVHGISIATTVVRVTDVLFGDKPFSELSSEELSIVKDHAPVIITKDGIALVDGLMEANLACSKREARTFIKSGAVTINGIKVVDIDTVLTAKLFGKFFLLKRGKKTMSVFQLEL